MEIFISLVTSSLIVGLFGFIIKETYKSKLSEFSKKIDLLHQYKAKDFDIALDSIKSIWSQIVVLDDYIRYDLPNDIMSSKISNDFFRKSQLEISKSIVLLPAPLFFETEKCLEEISKAGNYCMNGIGEIFHMKEQKSISEPEALKKANQLLKDFQSSAKSNLGKLRKVFREHVSMYVENA